MTGFLDALKDLFGTHTEVTTEYMQNVLKKEILDEVEGRVNNKLVEGGYDDEILIPTYTSLKGEIVDSIKLFHYYDINTIAPEYLQTNYKRIECVGVCTIKDINKLDIIQRWNIVKQAYEVTHYDNETWIKFSVKDDNGKQLILGKSWIAKAQLVHKTGKTTFIMDELSPDDVAYISGIVHNLGKNVTIKQER